MLGPVHTLGKALRITFLFILFLFAGAPLLAIRRPSQIPIPRRTAGSRASGRTLAPRVLRQTKRDEAVSQSARGGKTKLSLRQGQSRPSRGCTSSDARRGAEPPAEKEKVDGLEEKSRELRNAYLLRVQECGDCAIRDVPPKPNGVISISSTYLSDGSCQLPTEDPTALAVAFQRANDFLLNLKRYPKENNGFYSILEFLGVDYQTGEKLPDLGKLESSPFFTFIAVLGFGPILPVPGLSAPTAFSYFTRGVFTKDDDLDIYFHADTPPEEFKRPDVFVTKASGEKIKAATLFLSQVAGSWFIRKDGYRRYCTSAVFPGKLKLSAIKAREILLDTLVSLMELSTTEKPADPAGDKL